MRSEDGSCGSEDNIEGLESSLGGSGNRAESHDSGKGKRRTADAEFEVVLKENRENDGRETPELADLIASSTRLDYNGHPVPLPQLPSDEEPIRHGDLQRPSIVSYASLEHVLSNLHEVLLRSTQETDALSPLEGLTFLLSREVNYWIKTSM